MVFPGVVRKINKNLPTLLQIVLVICVIHFMGQNVLLRVQKKLHVGRFTAISSTPPPALTGSGGGGRGSGGAGRAPGRPGGGFNKKFKSSTSTTTTTTTTTTTPLPPLPDTVMEEEHQRRLDILRKTCEKWNLGLYASSGKPRNVSDDVATSLDALPKSPLYQVLLVSEKYNLAVCPVARNGIQWLSRRLLQLTQKFEESQLHRLHEPASVIARHNYPYLSSWEKYPIVLAKTVNLLMARHPLDRLLASYRYLLENPERNPQGYLHYGRRIVRTYRQSPGRGKAPTFEEFVRFLLARDMAHVEEAWQPVVRRCTPCHIPYNTIVHFETLWHDVQWAWERAGIGKLNTTDYVQQSLTPEIRRQYFSELTLMQVLQLYKKYKLDFELFGYTLDEHMAYAQPGEDPIDPAAMAEVPHRDADRLQMLLQEKKEQTPMGSVLKQAPPPGPGSITAMRDVEDLAAPVGNGIEEGEDNILLPNLEEQDE